MYMIMKAEVLVDGEWQAVGKVFQSALQPYFWMGEKPLTDRVCDARNPILYVVFGAPHVRRNKRTEIETMPYVDNGGHITYLDELVGYNWNAPVSDIGIISEFQYKRWQESGIEPTNVNRYVVGKDAKIVTPFEMDMILMNDNLRVAKKYYVKFNYNTRTVKDECAFFCNTSIPALMKLVPSGGTMHDVRVRYAFVES